VLRLAAAGLCAAGFCSLAACGGSSTPDTSAHTVGIRTSDVTATPSASTTTPSGDPAVLAAQQGAIAAVRRYYATIDTLYSNPMSAYNVIYTVSTGGQAGIDRASIGQERLEGLKQVGRQSIVTITAGAVSLTNLPKHKPNPVFPTVQVRTCNDVSKVRSVDAKGVSHVARGRKDFFLNTLTVTNIAYPAAGSWRVSAITDKEASACS
jgi:phosphoribosylformylglycinamidine (FGAM) synthase-like enzyme